MSLSAAWGVTTPRFHILSADLSYVEKTIYLPSPTKKGLSISWDIKGTFAEMADGSKAYKAKGYTPKVTLKYEVYNDVQGESDLPLGPEDGQIPTAEDLLQILTMYGQSRLEFSPSTGDPFFRCLITKLPTLTSIGNIAFKDFQIEISGRDVFPVADLGGSPSSPPNVQVQPLAAIVGPAGPMGPKGDPGSVDSVGVNATGNNLVLSGPSYAPVISLRDDPTFGPLVATSYNGYTPLNKAGDTNINGDFVFSSTGERAIKVQGTSINWGVFLNSTGCGFQDWENGRSVFSYTASLNSISCAPSLAITDTTPSTSSTTGALVVSGGVGVGGDIRLSGDLKCVAGNLSLANEKSLYIKDSAGTERKIVSVNSSNDTYLGPRDTGWGLITYLNAGSSLTVRVNGNSGTFTSALTVSNTSLSCNLNTATVGNGTAGVNIGINGASTLGKYLYFKTAGVNRIGLETINGEGGSESGSDLYIRTYDDSGTLIDNAVSLIRKAGGAFTVNRPASIVATRTETGSSTYAANSNTLTVNPSLSASSAFFNANYSVATTPAANTQNIGYVVGSNGIAQHYGSGTLSYLYGSMGQVYAGDGTNTPGLISEMTAVRTGISFRANCSVTSANGFLVASPSFGSGISVGAFYGLRVYDLKGTGISNSYGIYVNAQSSGGYALYTNAGTVRFGDSIYGTGSAFIDGAIWAGTNTIAGGMNINGPNNSGRYLYLRTAGVSRWALGAEGNETGSNSGSSFYLSAIDDTGTYIDSPITISRQATGTLTVNRPIQSNQELTIGTAAGVGKTLVLRSAAANSRSLVFQTASSNRWSFGASNGAETGSDAGSSLIVQAFNDAGTLIDQPLVIARAASGSITLNRYLQSNQGMTIGTSSGTSRFVVINSAAANSRSLVFQTASTNRWAIGANSTAEIGSDAGTSLTIDAYNDAGAYIDTPLTVGRASSSSIYLARPTQITNTTASTSSTTGALVVAGGVGIAGDTYFNGKLNLANLAASATNGDFWRDSTQKCAAFISGGLRQNLVGCIWTQTSTTAIAGTASTDLDMLGTGVGTRTLPADFLTTGKTIKIRVMGTVTTPSSVTGVTIKVKLGTTVVATSVATSPTANLSSKGFEAEFLITARATPSAASSIAASGYIAYNTGTAIPVINSNTTVATNASQDISVTVNHGATASSFVTTSHTATIEVLN